MRNPLLESLQQRIGVHFMSDGNLDFQDSPAARSARIAFDAAPALVTFANAGIPSFLSTYIDPKSIEALVAPMKAAMIVGDEVQKGDWTTDTAMFALIESTGEVSSYGDYSNNGRAGANINWPQRQSYHYQVITEWGERELARAGLARVDWANRLNVASILTLNKFQNYSYFFGVAGLQNYGLLNDPNLYAPIAPLVQNGVTQWSNPLKDGIGVLADIQALYGQLQSQSNALIDLETPMVLVMSPAAQVGLTKTNLYNNNVMVLLKATFPNLTIMTAPEYALPAGQFVQLIVKELDGQRTVDVAFTEKLRAHPIVIEMSAFKQKKSQGTWGAIVYRPFLIASMIGV